MGQAHERIVSPCEKKNWLNEQRNVGHKYEGVLQGVFIEGKLKDQNAKLTDYTLKGDSSIITLTKKMYDELLAVKRDYSAVIMLSVLNPSRGCDACVSFYKEYKVVASSWNYFHSDPEKVYYFFADYDEAPNVFATFNIQGAPVLLHLPSGSQGKKKHSQMELRSKDDLTAPGIAKWLESQIKKPVKIKYPFPWIETISAIVSGAVIITVLYYTKDKFSLKIISLQNILAVIILVIVYYFISGAMWNTIHKSPFSVPGKTWLDSYIGRERMEQLVAETYIIMSFYALSTIGFLIMAEAPYFKGKKAVRVGVMILGLGLYVGLFQAMISVAVFKESVVPHKASFIDDQSQTALRMVASCIVTFLSILEVGVSSYPGLSLNEKVHQLSELNMKRPVIKLNSEKFKLYVKSTPRNYSVIVMLTALSDNRQCQMCKLASEEFQLVANSWRYSQIYSNKLFFAVVDYDEAADVFASLGKSSVPVFLHFPAKGKPKKEDEMPIQTQGFHAEAISRWVTERTDLQFKIFRPPSYAGTIALVILFTMIAALLYLRRSNLDFLYNRSMWALLALCTVFIFTSGQMWNHIRGPPFLNKGQNGEVVNASVVFGMILMTEAASSDGDIKKRRIMAVFGVGVVAVFYGLILSIFRNKAGGYPYSFLFK
ncbi:Magnesium transporter protein 1 [Nymphon striatum]|nr:Magnesium transporter protein 1 [Nymphon striatum]